MNATRKLTALFAGLLAMGAFAVAQEAGVDATTKQSLGNFDSTVFTLGERLDGWWKLPLDKNGSIFEGSAHVGVDLSATDDPAKASNGRGTTANLTGDADRVRIAFVIPNPTTEIKSMNIEAGRLPMRDPTGLIVSLPADGALLGIEYPFMKGSVQGGFTTLILRNANDIALSQYDKLVSDDSKKILGTSPAPRTRSDRVPELLEADAQSVVPRAAGSQQELKLHFRMDDDEVLWHNLEGRKS